MTNKQGLWAKNRKDVKMHKNLLKIYLHIVFTAKKKYVIIRSAIIKYSAIYVIHTVQKRRELYDRRKDLGGYKSLSNVFV